MTLNNENIAKKIIDCKNKFWIVVDAAMLNQFFTEKERDSLKERFLLRKLPNLNVYVLWIPKSSIQDELFILMNKFHILKYYHYKYNAFISPLTFLNLIWNSESLLKFKLLSIKDEIVNKTVKTWQLTIEIESSAKIYKELILNKFQETYTFQNLSFVWLPKSLYMLFSKFDWKSLSQGQLDFLLKNKKLLDYNVLNVIKNLNVITEYNDDIYQQTQFKYLDIYKEKIMKFKEQLKAMNLKIKPFASKVDFFDYINDQKIKDIYNTTTIEGEEIGYKDLIDYLNWNREIFVTQPQKLQIIGYENAFQKVLSEKITLDETGMKTINSDIFYPLYEYKFVPEPTWWIYSNSQRYIWHKTPYMLANGISPTIPPSPDKVPYLMHLLDEFLVNDKDLNIFEKALIFHIIFIEIHPFQDWNWRTARLFFNRLISTERIWWVVIPWEERDSYFDRINFATQDYNIVPFAQYYYDKLVNWNKEIKIFKH